MRLESARVDTISNLKSGKKFGIEASAKAFQVLSSNLYERKIEAIVRELGCNASDSHFEAGKADVPFKVTLPTMLNPRFVVQDFGLGLSQEDVEEVYTTYFKSTKTGSNDLIGGLGLGSKTPFSYTDSFMVTAIKDGIKCAFTCNIGESGEPEVNKLFETKTTECNGVTVEVSVNESDIYTFNDAAGKVYQWFDVKPETNRELNFKIDQSIVDSLKDYGFYLHTNRQGSMVGTPTVSRYRSSRQMKASKVIMGQVAYDLNIEDALSNATTEVKEFVEEMCSLESELYMCLPIGDADVNAGREKLSLDDRTIKNIQAKIEEIRLNLRQTALDKITKFTSVLQAEEELNSIEKKIIYTIPINGRTLKELRTEPVGVCEKAHPILHKMDSPFYVIKRSGMARQERKSYQTHTDIINKKEYTVVVNDCELKGGLIGAIKDNNALPSSVFTILDKKTVMTPELHAELTHMFYGRYTIVLASSFWDGSRAAKKQARKIGSESIRCTVINQQSTSNTGTIDFSGKDKSKYAIIYGSASESLLHVRLRGNARRDYMTRSHIQRMLVELDLEGVVLYNKSNEGKVKKNFSKTLEDEINMRYNRSEVMAMVLKTQLERSEFNSSYRVFEGFEVMYDKILADYKAITKLELAELFAVSECNSHNDVFEGRFKVFEKRRELLREKSPMLNHCLTRGINSSMITELKQYIKLIEKKGN